MTPECNGPVTGLVVSDPMHLLALHKAIMEAKFHESPENQDVLGSPLLASIADQVMDAIIILPDGWTRRATPDGYTFVAPLSEPNEDDVWRVIRFLKHKSLFACRHADHTDHREYEVVSCTESGVGFRLLFHLTR